MSAGCPFCDARSPRLLPFLSDIAFVNYYRCDSCGAVWNVAKDEPDAPLVIVAHGRVQDDARPSR